MKDHKKQQCFVCGLESPKGKTHKHCTDNTTPDYLIVANKYEEIEKDIIHQLKYQNKKQLSQIIVERLIIKLKNYNLKDYVVCPIPLHKKRFKERGFNQVELITNILANKLKISSKNLLLREKNTKPQHLLNKKEREQNLDKAFIIRDNTNVPIKIILVDDLTTSGSTFKEATRVLKENGASEVICLAFARGN